MCMHCAWCRHAHLSFNAPLLALFDLCTEGKRQRGKSIAGVTRACVPGCVAATHASCCTAKPSCPCGWADGPVPPRHREARSYCRAQLRCNSGYCQVARSTVVKHLVLGQRNERADDHGEGMILGEGRELKDERLASALATWRRVQGGQRQASRALVCVLSVSSVLRPQPSRSRLAWPGAWHSPADGAPPRCMHRSSPHRSEGRRVSQPPLASQQLPRAGTAGTMASQS